MGIQKIYAGSATGAKEVKKLYAADPDGKSVLIYDRDPVKIVSWANGTDKEIADMIDAADLGLIDLADYWSVGDVRTVTYTATTLGANSMDWVLTDFNGTTSGGTKYNAVIHTKDLHPTTAQMNSTNTNVGGWQSSAMRTNVMPVIYNNLPSALKSIIKQAAIVSGSGNAQNTIQTTYDNIWLFSEMEVQGATTYAGTAEAAECKQMEYFKTASNKVKTLNGSAHNWWLRSPSIVNATNFSIVSGSGIVYSHDAFNSYGVASAAII